MDTIDSFSINKTLGKVNSRIILKDYVALQTSDTISGGLVITIIAASASSILLVVFYYKKKLRVVK